MISSRAKTAALYTLCYLSGGAALGQQIAWSRMFATGLGHEIPAVLAVLCAFLGGLALGAAGLDRAICRSGQPGRWYAWLEIVIAAWACLSILIIPHVNELALNLIGLNPNPLRHWAIGFALPFLVLLPATAAMGATLPAMERFVCPWVKDGRCLGALYSANTLGGVTGVLASAFLIVPMLGLSRGVGLLAQINLACGVTALFLSVSNARLKNDAASEPIAPGGVSVLRLKVTVFLTGCLGIGYEVVGIRVLSQVLENTVYTYAVALAVFLLATSLGAALYQKWLQSKPVLNLLSIFMGLLSLTCALGMFVLSQSHKIYEACRDLLGDSLGGVVLAEMVPAGLTFTLPALIMGATFSHLLQLSRRPSGGVGLTVAWNALGGALAPLLFGLGLLPWLGAKWALVVITLGYLALLPELSWRYLAMGTCALISGVLMQLQPLRVPDNSTVKQYREGVMASVAVIEDVAGHKTLRVNNRFQMGGTAAAGKEYLQAHIPLLLHPQPRRALFLGTGTGITIGAATVHPDLRSDGVELVPEVVAVMPEFEPHNFFAARSPAVAMHVADARRFVRATVTQYDVIVADLFHPARDGAGSLYTVEHFSALRSRLAPEGLVCQWLPLYQLDEATLKVIVRTFLNVFPDTQAWLLQLNVDTPALGLVGGLKGRVYPEMWLERRLESPQLTAELKKLAVADSVRFFGHFVADGPTLVKFAGSGLMNTDDDPWVVFNAPQFSFQRNATSYGRLMVLLDHAASHASDGVFESIGFAERVRVYREARDVYLRGLVADAEGRHSEAVDAYVESARLSADFTSGYAQCLTLASLQAKTKPDEAKDLLRRLAKVQPDRPIAREMLERLGDK